MLISVLVCLSVAMLLFASWLQAGLQERRQVRAQQDRMQAELLALSGLERAAAQLATNADYQGETWNLEPAAFGGPSGGKVEIQVTRPSDDAGSRRVRVVADFPAEGTAQARRSKEITMVLNKVGASP
jgi:type II secretory pathway pseudopilin PulG